MIRKRLNVAHTLTRPDAWYNHWSVYAVTISILPCVNLLQWWLYLHYLDNTVKFRWPWFMTLPIFGFVVIPLMDMAVLPLAEKLYSSSDKVQTTAECRTKKIRNASRRGGDNTMYSAVMYWYVLLHTVVYFATMRWMGTYLRPWTMEFLLATFSLAMLSVAPGVAVGHELFHKLTWYESALGNWMMNLFMYGHFKYLHCQHHHKWVATPYDPATAQRGESIYSFIPRSALSGYLLTWREIELKRLRERGIPFLSMKNRMLVAFALSFVILPLGISVLFGRSSLIAFFLQSILAIIMVETVNYFEHYGLQRQRKTKSIDLSTGSMQESDGEPPALSSFERVTHMHSWDAFYPISNYLSLNLNFHAFHHRNPLALYNAMQPALLSPRMPLPYPFMFVVALIPPLFFRIVHSILQATN